jgi:hypothetical protein
MARPLVVTSVTSYHPHLDCYLKPVTCNLCPLINSPAIVGGFQENNLLSVQMTNLLNINIERAFP